MIPAPTVTMVPSPPPTASYGAIRLSNALRLAAEGLLSCALSASLKEDRPSHLGGGLEYHEPRAKDFEEAQKILHGMADDLQRPKPSHKSPISRQPVVRLAMRLAFIEHCRQNLEIADYFGSQKWIDRLGRAKMRLKREFPLASSVPPEPQVVPWEAWGSGGLTCVQNGQVVKIPSAFMANTITAQ